MLEGLKKQIPGFRERYGHLFKEKNADAGTVLLREGEIPKNMYFIKNGCLRIWFNKDGKDITIQFFFENSAVSSLESFMNRKPSPFNIEAVEPSVLYALSRNDFEKLHREIPELKDGFNNILLKRLENYMGLFLSRIKDTPRERYLDLLKNNPQILSRVPQHYIASYLGITPVSLSRIKNKK